MEFKHYSDNDYQAVCDFLIELNRDGRRYINWNWARFEWMMEHPDFDASLKSSIGLWTEGKKIIGAAIYDMYFGEAFVGALSEYSFLLPEILDYAFSELKDSEGLAIAIGEECLQETEVAIQRGFSPIEQTETMMRIDLNTDFPVQPPTGTTIESFDPGDNLVAFQWLLWQGFDHGNERTEFEQAEQTVTKKRKHFNQDLSLVAISPEGEMTAYCCLWFHEGTDYAYVEPVCTIPAWRGKGIAKALLYEAMNRVHVLGAQCAYVISDQSFYEKIGFQKEGIFRFFRKKAEE